MPEETKSPVQSVETQWVTPFRVLGLMSAMFFLIYLDRGTIASTGVNGTEPSDADPDGSGLQGEFGLTNAEDGILSSMFMIGMSVAIPVCSEAIYYFNAFRLVGCSLLIWSLATCFCGLSFDFYSIAFCRMFVGVGEAAIISLAPPYIGNTSSTSILRMLICSDDAAPPKQKTVWLACLFLAVPLGYASGYGYGSFVGSKLGWRAAFILEGIFMAPLVLFCFLSKPLRLNMKTETEQEGNSFYEMNERYLCVESLEERRERRLMKFWRHTKEIFSHRVYVYLLIGYIFYTAFIGVVAYWGAKAAKAAYAVQDIAVGGSAAILGLSGTLMGGWLLDRIGSTIPKAMIMSAICCFIPGIACAVGFLLNVRLVVFIPMYIVTILLLYALQAPVQASVLWCVPTNHRTLANGVSVLLIHLFGDVPAPPLFGAVLDVFKHRLDMDEDMAYTRALSLMAVVLLFAGCFFLRAAIVGRSAKDYRTSSSSHSLPSTRMDDSDVPLLN